MIRSRRAKPRPGRLQGKALTELRDACFERDEGTCKICGLFVLKDAPPEDDRSYHMAHKKAKRIGLDTLDNLQVECGRCHRAFHNYGPSRTKPCPPKHSC